MLWWPLYIFLPPLCSYTTINISPFLSLSTLSTYCYVHCTNPLYFYLLSSTLVLLCTYTTTLAIKRISSFSNQYLMKHIDRFEYVVAGSWFSSCSCHLLAALNWPIFLLAKGRHNVGNKRNKPNKSSNRLTRRDTARCKQMQTEAQLSMLETTRW